MNWTRTWTLAFVLLFCCQANENQKSSGAQAVKPDSLGKSFIGSEIAGVFSGTVAKLSELKNSSVQRYLSLCDGSGDTIVFRIFLANTDSPTANVIESKLGFGMCVKVHYVTEIVEEDGVEFNRFYYATRLDYP